MACILALDQGTTSSRAILFDETGRPIATAQREFMQIFPAPGLVEHDPEEIARTQIEVANEVVDAAGVDVAAVGITNQRETTVVWDRASGSSRSINAIVWQDRRTADAMRDRLEGCRRRRPRSPRRRTRTGRRSVLLGRRRWRGSSTTCDGARPNEPKRGELASRNDRLVARVEPDSRVAAAARDRAGAMPRARCSLIIARRPLWSDELLELLRVPRAMLPSTFDRRPPVRSPRSASDSSARGDRADRAHSSGDQQAATLRPVVSSSRGLAKNTYGTGCFLLLNTGDDSARTHRNIACSRPSAWRTRRSHGRTALEGSIFVGGALVQWMRDGLGIIKHARPTSKPLARSPSIRATDEVYVVPALAGLGAPHWDPNVRAASIVGITRGTTAGHIARAALEGIAHRSGRPRRRDARTDSGSRRSSELRVDGGAAANDLMMQFQADLLDIPLVRPVVTETTALGAAYLAGLAVGTWPDLAAMAGHWAVDRRFEPRMPRAVAEERRSRWREAVARSRGWTCGGDE